MPKFNKKNLATAAAIALLALTIHGCEEKGGNSRPIESTQTSRPSMREELRKDTVKSVHDSRPTTGEIQF